MSQIGRRILLAVGPGVLEGALAEVLAANDPTDEVVQHRRDSATPGAAFDAAVVCIELPDDVHSDVVITLPDTRGSAGTGTVRNAQGLHEVEIEGLEQVINLLDEYAPRAAAAHRPAR